VVNPANEDSQPHVFLPIMFISTGIAHGQRLDNCFFVMEGHTSDVTLFAYYMENSGDFDPYQLSQTSVRNKQTDRFNRAKNFRKKEKRGQGIPMPLLSVIIL
jgi:hypothetical protein